MASTSNSNTPGPSSIGSFAFNVGDPISGDLVSRRDWLVHKHSEHKARVDAVTNIVNGEWYVEWPDLTRTPEAPTVANIIELGVSHWASIGGAMLPSLRVPTNISENVADGRRGARKRERRLRELFVSSNASEMAALLWGDYAGTGSAICGAWVNFEEKNASKRNPFLIRYDPRFTYPLKNDTGDIVELLVARVISGAELVASHPNLAHLFEDSGDEDVEEWFWYTEDKFMYALVDVSEEGRAKSRSRVILDKDNPLGFVPVWEATRPSFDGQRRGVFDQTLHVLRTMHRLMHMTVLSTEEQVFSPVVEFNITNPEDFGPGGMLHARSADSSIQRVGPTSLIDTKDMIARLADEARQGAVWPQQLSGEPGASIVSSRGIKASMGALDARLALCHKQFEVLFGKVGGFLLAMDEHFCDGEKQIVGDWRDNRKAENFLPSRDIAGQYQVRATYGLGAGSDPQNTEVRLGMHLANGGISLETYRDQLFLEDPDAEPLRVARETGQQALLAGVYAQASQGNPGPAAKLLDLLRKEDVDFDSVVAELIEFLQPPEPAPGPGPGSPLGGDGGLESLQGAESLARGGIPGNAEQAPPPGLPPLGGIMSQDARLVS